MNGRGTTMVADFNVCDLSITSQVFEMDTICSHDVRPDSPSGEEAQEPAPGVHVDRVPGHVLACSMELRSVGSSELALWRLIRCPVGDQPGMVHEVLRNIVCVKVSGVVGQYYYEANSLWSTVKTLLKRSRRQLKSVILTLIGVSKFFIG